MEQIKEIYEYRNMINSLVRRELRGRYEKSALGFLWSFLSPLFQILIYNIVFTRIFHNDMPNFYIYLMTGLLPWTFFADAVSQGTGAIISNAEMVKKIYFPREVLVIAEVSAKLVNMLLSFIVMTFFIIVSGTGFSIHLILLPVVVVIEYIFAVGIALIVSSVTVYLRDLEYVVNVIMMAWIWGTPVLYSLDVVNEGFLRRLVCANPMSGIICSYHYILYNHVWPGYKDLLYPFLESVAVVILGAVVFQIMNRRFVEEL